MENVPPLDAVTFSVTRYNLWVACRLQSIGDMVKAEMDRNRSFREEVRHSLAQLQAEVERLSNNSNAGANSGHGTANGNHSEDPRFDVSARISDMLGSTSASITEALLESESQPALLLAPYGLIPPARIPVGCFGDQPALVKLASPPHPPTSPTSSLPANMQFKVEEDEFNEVEVDEDDAEEEDEEVGETELTNDGEVTSNHDVASNITQERPKTFSVLRKDSSSSTPRPGKINYLEVERKKMRARQLASARMKRYRERQKLKKEMVTSLPTNFR